MTLTRSLVIFAVCLVIFSLNGKLLQFIWNQEGIAISKILIGTRFLLAVQAESRVTEDMAESGWSQEEEGLADNYEAFSFADAEEEELMEEREVKKQKSKKNINKLWKEINPIAWTIKRL